jgi:hypothetical protein
MQYSGNYHSYSSDNKIGIQCFHSLRGFAIGNIAKTIEKSIYCLNLLKMLNNLLLSKKRFNLDEAFNFVMKKIVITLVILGFAFGVKAQQFPFGLKAPQSGGLLKRQLLKPDSLIRNKFLFKKPDSLTGNRILFTPLDSTRVKAVKRINIYANANIDNMPIARMPGNSNMPIVQTDRTAYNMPIAGMNQPRVYIMKKPGENPEVLPANNKDGKK